MVLNRTFYIDIIISDPSTGEPIDPDSLPILSVFEDANDTPILEIEGVKRASITGSYRFKVETTTANGFEELKSYSLIGLAIVGGVTSKAVVSNFLIDDYMSTLINVAKDLNLCYNPIPEDFIPDMSAFTKPLDPGSLDSMFGELSDYEWKNYYIAYYDKVNNTWTDGNPGVVPGDTKADIETQLIAINIYEAALSQYNYDYAVQRDVQWRKYMAQKLIDVCA